MTIPMPLIVLLLSFLFLVALLWVIRKNRQATQAQKAQKPNNAIRNADTKNLNPIFSSAIPVSPTSKQSSLAKRNLDELLEIEESLLAVRELYLRKLIPVDVYVTESLKYAV
jgi:type VI protein secretion system component VasK